MAWDGAGLKKIYSNVKMKKTGKRKYAQRKRIQTVQPLMAMSCEHRESSTIRAPRRYNITREIYNKRHVCEIIAENALCIHARSAHT